MCRYAVECAEGPVVENMRIGAMVMMDHRSIFHDDHGAQSSSHRDGTAIRRIRDGTVARW
jgi:hypothetical protein